MHEFGDCSLCGGEVLGKRIELDYRHKGQPYIFQNVPAGVCQQCGETYLVASVAKEIEHRILTKRTWEKTIAVPVDVFDEVAVS